MGETPDDAEAQSKSSDDTQQAALNETSLQEVETAPEKYVASDEAAPVMTPTEADMEASFEEIAPEETEVASKETAPEKMDPIEADSEASFEKIAPAEAETALENVDPEETSSRGRMQTRIWLSMRPSPPSSVRTRTPISLSRSRRPLL